MRDGRGRALLCFLRLPPAACRRLSIGSRPRGPMPRTGPCGETRSPASLPVRAGVSRTAGRRPETRFTLLTQGAATRVSSHASKPVMICLPWSAGGHAHVKYAWVALSSGVRGQSKTSAWDRGRGSRFLDVSCRIWRSRYVHGAGRRNFVLSIVAPFTAADEEYKQHFAK